MKNRRHIFQRALLLFAVLITAWGGAKAAPSISLTSFNDPTTVCSGGQSNVVWVGAELTDAKTYIDISSNNGVTWNRKDSVLKDVFSCLITFPTQLGPNYMVRVRNGVTMDTCNSLIEIQALPLITTQIPSLTEKCIGSNVTLAPIISPMPNSFTYQWFKDGVALAGQTSPTITINNLQTIHDGMYSLEITGCQVVTSAPGKLAIGSNTIITQNPQNASGCNGGDITLTTVATGYNLTYQWKRNGTNIAGATRATYTVSPLSDISSGSYTCVVTGLCGTPQTSNAAIVSVLPMPITALNFTNDSTVCTGTSLRLEAHGTNGNQFTYIWKKNGSLLPYSDSAIVFDNVTLDAAGTYTVAAKNECENIAAEKSVKISVYSSPNIYRTTLDTTVYKGFETRLRVVAGGDEVKYLWAKDGVDRPKDTTATLIIYQTQFADSGSYTCKLTNKCATSTSDPIVVSVVNAPAGPKLILSKSDIDFGCVDKGTSQEITLDSLIKNTGELQLIVSDIKITGTNAANFQIISNPAPFNLNSGEKKKLTVKFLPGDIAINSASLSITSNSTIGTTTELPLKGTSCFENVITSAIGFGTVLTNETKDTTIKICNSGTKDMIINSLSINVKDGFTIKNAPTLPATVKAGECVLVTLTAGSKDPGNYTAELTVLSNNNGSYKFPMTVTIEAPSGIIEQANDYGISVYPNPAEGLVWLRTSKDITMNSISIVNLLGREVLHVNGGRLDRGNDIAISLNNVSQGAYTMLIHTLQGNVMSIPVMINR